MSSEPTTPQTPSPEPAAPETSSGATAAPQVGAAQTQEFINNCNRLASHFGLTPEEVSQADGLMRQIVHPVQVFMHAAHSQGEEPYRRAVIIAEYAMRVALLAQITARQAALGILSPEETVMLQEMARLTAELQSRPFVGPFMLDIPHTLALVTHVQRALSDPTATGHFSTMARRLADQLIQTLDGISPTLAKSLRAGWEGGAQ